jgi:hypothetical protein
MRECVALKGQQRLAIAGGDHRKLGPFRERGHEIGEHSVHLSASRCAGESGTDRCRSVSRSCADGKFKTLAIGEKDVHRGSSTWTR